MPSVGKTKSTESLAVHASPASKREDIVTASLPLGVQDDLDRKSSHSDVSILSGSKATASSKGSNTDVGMGDRQLGDDINHHNLRSAFFQVIEELRMRRSIDIENEERIRKLLDKNHLLQEKLEEEKSYSQVLIEKQHKMERDTKSQFEGKIKQAEYEKAKKVMMTESWDHELKGLKDEMRAIQLVKYDLEKKVTEQERELHLQTSSRDSYLSQMNQLDHKYSMALRQAEEISEQMERLEDNVRQSKDLHVKLQYVNEHQKCELEVYKNKLKGCQVELMEARVRCTEAQLGDGSSEESREQATKWKASEQELRMQLELNKQFQVQLSGVRNEHQQVLSQLKDAHSLIERHVDSIGSLAEAEGSLKGEVASLKETVQTLTIELDTSVKTTNSLKDELSNVDSTWNKKYTDVELRLEALKSDYTSLQESHDKYLDNKNRELEVAASKIDCLEEARNNLQEELDLAKKEADRNKSSSRKHTEQSDDRPDCTATPYQDEQFHTEVSKRDTAQTMEHTAGPSSQTTASCWPTHTPGAALCETESVSDREIGLLNNSTTDGTTLPNVNIDLCYSPEFLAGSLDPLAPQSAGTKQPTQLSSEVNVKECGQPKVSRTISKLLANVCLEKLPVFKQKVTSVDKGTEAHSTKVPLPVESDNASEGAAGESKRKLVSMDNQTDGICQPPSLKKQKICNPLNLMETEENSTPIMDPCVENTSSESPGGLSPVCVDSALPRIMASGNQSGLDPSRDGVQSEVVHGDNQAHFSTVIHSPVFEDESMLPPYKGANPSQQAGDEVGVDDTNADHGQGGKTNLFSIVFSDDEDDHCSLKDDRLLNTQLSNQVDKVQKFLKKDKLRRPKTF